MTVATTEPGSNLPATANNDGLDSGLDDLDASDFVVPRLVIQHKTGVFKDNLTNQELPVLRGVLLGLVKQRVMWNPTVDEGDKPLCKSPDFEHGFPNVTDTRPGKHFPWDKSNFDPSMAVPLVDGFGPMRTESSNGHPVLPCANCKFKEWETAPNGKNPWCSEQYTMPFMYEADGEGGPLTLALLTVQKSGITPAKRYLTGFARSKTPAYQVMTQISLNQQQRGQVDYSVPVFTKLGETDRADWPEYSDSYRSIRAFVQLAPRSKEDEEAAAAAAAGTTPEDNAWAGPEPTAEPAPAAAPVAEAPAQTAQPAAAPAAPAPAAPAPAAAAPAAPAPAAAPPPPAAAPAPAAPAAAPAPVADDDLPF